MSTPRRERRQYVRSMSNSFDCRCHPGPEKLSRAAVFEHGCEAYESNRLILSSGGRPIKEMAENVSANATPITRGRAR